MQQVKRALEEKLEFETRQNNHKNRRSSSVTSTAQQYTSFHQELSRQNMLHNPNVATRNANHSNTMKDEKDKHSTGGRSRMLSQKRLTVDGDMASSVHGKSKNFSSRRDLKELIFVDQRAFAINIDALNNVNNTQTDKKQIVHNASQPSYNMKQGAQTTKKSAKNKPDA